jgi:2-dehydro-3-deoxyphosphooctonate aldolase (KDO 8-P synthase)
MHFNTSFNEITMGPGSELVLFAGPCVIEDYEITLSIARFLKQLTNELKIPFVFKASYDKANRTSLQSYRGPGMEKGLEILSCIKQELSVPILSDVHSSLEVEAAAQVLDILQIPAFLCRQTDLILTAARTGKPVNIKKGQFLSPWEMIPLTEKVTSTGNRQILLTERGTTFGYSNLVVDFRSIRIMQDIGFPVVFDATHSVQLPGGAGTHSGGQREFAPLLAKAAVAAGADGIFLEVHPDPDHARCDGPNSLPLTILHDLLSRLSAIRRVAADIPPETS